MKINSVKPMGVPMDILVEGMEYSNIVYMCIKEAGHSEYQVPENLNPLVDQLLQGVYRLQPSLYGDDWKKYCYLTVKRMHIQPEAVANRDGWHIDGFKSDQDNFIWCDSIPTQVSVGQFDITDDHDISLDEMNEQAMYCDKKRISLDENTLYLLDQQCVHNVSKNDSGKVVLRTFLKITFSSELFNCLGNAWNYKIPHIKPSVQRKDIRNHGAL